MRSERISIRSDITREPVFILKNTRQKNGDFGHHTFGWNEVRRTEHLLGIVPNIITVAFQTLDPVLAGRAITLDREVNNAIFFAPRTAAHSFLLALIRAF